MMLKGTKVGSETKSFTVSEKVVETVTVTVSDLHSEIVTVTGSEAATKVELGAVKIFEVVTLEMYVGRRRRGGTVAVSAETS